MKFYLHCIGMLYFARCACFVTPFVETRNGICLVFLNKFSNFIPCYTKNIYQIQTEKIIITYWEILLCHYDRLGLHHFGESEISMERHYHSELSLILICYTLECERMKHHHCPISIVIMIDVN